MTWIIEYIYILRQSLWDSRAFMNVMQLEDRTTTYRAHCAHIR